MPTKQVIILRRDLKMSPGKAAAQACHAAVSAARAARGAILAKWDVEGTTKVVLAVDDEKAFVPLLAKASKAGLAFKLIADAGHTELAPGTVTALAIGPADEATIDKITGALPLY